MLSSVLNILLIDHKECDVAPIGKRLTSLGMAVKKVSCSEVGKKALEESSDFHAIIARATMPGKSGSELAEWAKANNHTSPVFLLTERDWQLQENKLTKLGISGIISDECPIEEVHGKLVSHFTMAS